MHDPYFDHRLDANALPPLLRLAGIVLSLAIIGVFLVDAFVARGAA